MAGTALDDKVRIMPREKELKSFKNLGINPISTNIESDLQTFDGFPT